MTGGREHWEAVYRTRDAADVSWYRPHLERSLAFIDRARLGLDAAILDVGGGASTLVDDLLARGYRNVSVLDLSAAAVESAKQRLGARAAAVRWIVGDVLEADLPEHSIDFWHDRAVFHFLVDDAARRRYVDVAQRALREDAHIVVATFGPEGPEKCSGLPVARYDADALHGQFGGEFTKVASETEVHRTPWGSEQEFVYCYCRHRS